MMAIREGDWIKYNVREPFDRVDEVHACLQGYYVVRDGVCIYPSQIIEVRPKPQGEKEMT